jgi:hypothetical protein
MEFTDDIILAGIKEAGESLKCGGRYVQTAEQLKSFDYSEMNALLANFLDAMVEDYTHQRSMKISGIMEKMLVFSNGNIHDIDHLIRVWTYAKTIGELEELNQEMQYILEIAAITHDIACALCREKYGNTSGKYQEVEGALMVRDFLKGTGVSEAQVERVAFLVGHHHTLTGIDGMDYQILVEADYIANATENGYSKENVANFLEKVMKTESGKHLLKAVSGM